MKTHRAVELRPRLASLGRVPADSAAPKALPPAVSYSVIGDAALAALQHVHEHSSTCPDHREQAWYSPNARYPGLGCDWARLFHFRSTDQRSPKITRYLESTG